LLGRLGNVLARSGRSAEARALIEEIDRRDRILPLAKVHLAMIHTGLGEKRRAMDLLWQAAAEHASDAVFLAVEPVFDPLRNEPGYRGLCTLLGLP
jgi:hypothetical protein